jgi:hypothetical protein
MKESANELRTRMLEFVEEFIGAEQCRHPMFSEGYDYALWQMKQIIEKTEHDPYLRNDEAS